MARSVETIYNSLLAAKSGTAALDGLDSSSATAIWRLWLYIVAVAINVHEGLFDAHKAEVTSIINAELPHTTRWYVWKAKAFQYGDSLPTDSDTYATIDASLQIVTQAACTESAGRVRLKAAKGTDTLAALSSAELAALTAYMQQVKDAGVRLTVTSGAADDLRIGLKVYYDPLLLDATGARLDGTSVTPVKDAIAAFLTQLPFNGLMVVNKLLDAVRAVEGVVNCSVITVAARYGDLSFAPVEDEYLPDAGYLINDGDYFDANVIYTAHELL
jgi:hypothetical protein